jgi:hypothetical protein
MTTNSSTDAAGIKKRPSLTDMVKKSFNKMSGKDSAKSPKKSDEGIQRSNSFSERIREKFIGAKAEDGLKREPSFSERIRENFKRNSKSSENGSADSSAPVSRAGSSDVLGQVFASPIEAEEASVPQTKEVAEGPVVEVAPETLPPISEGVTVHDTEAVPLVKEEANAAVNAVITDIIERVAAVEAPMTTQVVMPVATPIHSESPKVIEAPVTETASYEVETIVTKDAVEVPMVLETNAIDSVTECDDHIEINEPKTPMEDKREYESMTALSAEVTPHHLAFMAALINLLLGFTLATICLFAVNP